MVENMIAVSELAQIPDDLLVAATERAARAAHRCTAVLLAHLAEVDRRRLFRNMAYESMHEYCTRRLGLSDSAAFLRIRAARLARQYPVVLELVGRGRIHLTALNLMSPHLNPANHRELLAAACGKTRREVEELVAQLFPQPDRRDVVRRLPVKGGATPRNDGVAPSQTGPAMAQPVMDNPTLPEQSAQGAGFQPVGPASSKPDPDQDTRGGYPTRPNSARLADLPGPGQVSGQPGSQPRCQDQAEDRITPTAPSRYRLAVTIDVEGYRLLEQVQALMIHRKAGQELGSVITEALALLKDRLETERFGSPRRRTMEGDGHGAPAGKDQAAASGASRGHSGPCVTRPKEEMAGNKGEAGHSAQSAVQNTARETEEAQAETSTATKDEPAPATQIVNKHKVHRSGRTRDESVQPKTRSRYIPKNVRRAVYDRDGGQCTFVDPRTGRRCGSRRVQIHHKDPWCTGGSHTVDNLTLRCKCHNDLAAEQDLGPVAVQGRARAMANRQQVDLPLGGLP